MLAGSIGLSKLASGTIRQIIIVNALGNVMYGSLSLNTLPFRTADQFLQPSGSNNTWATLSGDASLSSGVLTIGNAAITNAKLLNSIITLDVQAMSLGASYTTPLLAITNAMLTGSIALSKLASGTIGQIIIVNALGNAIYWSLTLNNLPFGTANQIMQTSGSNNAWITLSGDASLSSGVLTIGNAAITNAKLLNSIITLNGQAMSWGSSFTTPLLAITNAMLAGSITLS